MNHILYFILLLGTWFFYFLIYLHLDYEWLLPAYKHSNNIISLSEINVEYDYIIVGAGSAGSVIAHRLSQNASLRVLLIEAGPVGGPILDIPAAIPLLQLSDVDWKYKTTSQENAAQALNEQKSNWPRGKLVGGSGRLNNMLYIRGHPEDYLNWFPPQWKLDKPNFHEREAFLKYYWKRSENQQGRYINDTEGHGTFGPLTASDLPFRTVLSTQFESAAFELNITKRDLNRYYTGFDVPQANVKNGARYSTGHFLLDQLHSKPNLHLVTHTEVVNINFLQDYEATSVIAVSHQNNDDKKEIFARHGIIVCAGAINTPKLLQLSGIGDPEHLTTLGIRTVVDLTEVGMNLQDHIGAGIDLVKIKEPLELNAYSLVNPVTVYNYIKHGKGPLATVQCEAMIIGHIDCLWSQARKEDDFETCDQKHRLNAPDFQIMVLPLGMTTDYGAQLYETLGFSRSIYDSHYASLHGTPTVLLIPIVLHPKSHGSVRINSTDPWQAPIINPNYLSHPYDIDVLLKGIRFMQELVQTPAMQELGAEIDSRPFPKCSHLVFDSNDYWKCYIRQITLTIYHPVGTAALGKVLEYNFKVKRTNKLFVADASALPDLPSGNPNAAVVLAAELASDRIKDELVLSTGRCHQNEVFIIKHSTSIFT